MSTDPNMFYENEDENFEDCDTCIHRDAGNQECDTCEGGRNFEEKDD